MRPGLLQLPSATLQKTRKTPVNISKETRQKRPKLPKKYIFEKIFAKKTLIKFFKSQKSKIKMSYLVEKIVTHRISTSPDKKSSLPRRENLGCKNRAANVLLLFLLGN